VRLRKSDPILLGQTRATDRAGAGCRHRWAQCRYPRRPCKSSAIRHAPCGTRCAPALLRPPCVVAFSGGRDSSRLLAAAADLAAREDLAPPTAYTFRYPLDPAADESHW